MKNIVKEYNSKKLKNDESLTEAVLKTYIGDHKECLKNGNVEVVNYGDSNTSVECTYCNEVIIDSDVLNVDCLSDEIVYSLCGDDIFSVIDSMGTDTMDKLEELEIKNSEILDFIRQKIEIPWSEYVEECIKSLICRASKNKEQ